MNFFSNQLINGIIFKWSKKKQVRCFIIRLDEVKCFIKLSNNKESSSSIYKKSFVYESNRLALNLQVKGNAIRSFKSDYCFNEYENTILIFSKLKSVLMDNLKKKNLAIFNFGEKSLGNNNRNIGKSKLFYGKKGKFSQDSLLRYLTDQCLEEFKGKYDFIVYDIIGISKERFIVDLVNFVLQRKIFHMIRISQ